jgi:hypothetical protein
MSQNPSHRTEHFKANCLAWSALYHFLPAHLLRELSYVLVEVISQNQIQFRQLFEEDLVIGHEGLASWAVRPIIVTDPLAQYIQRRIRYFVWSNDGDVYYEKTNQQTENTVNPGSLEDAIRLGRADLNVLDQLDQQFNFSTQGSIGKLYGAMKLARELCRRPDNLLNLKEILELCDSAEFPLDAVLLKHLGDLFADDDRWYGALGLYEASHNRLERNASEYWTGYVEILRGITTQSIAAALRTTGGAGAAANYLAPKVEATTLVKSPLFLLNASHDALMAEIHASGTFRYGPDRRASILIDPLLLKSKDLSSALESSSNGEYDDAHQQFWSILRRQIALGSAIDMRTTQAHYAKSVLEALDKKAESQLNQSSFAMGIRLLVQSGQTDFTKKLRWSEALVRAYVDDDAFNLVKSKANVAEKASDERIGVAIELIHGWGLVFPVEQAVLAETMLRFVAEIGTRSQTSFAAYQNIGGRCIEVLCNLAEKRPEFRAGIAGAIVPLVLSKIGKGTFWKARSDALKLAILYLGVLKPDDITAIVSVVLSQLATVDPARDDWAIVQPSLDLILSPEVQSLSKQDQELGQRVVSTVLRFGLNQKTEHVRLLYYLYRFDLASVHQEPTRTQLQEVILEVRKQALTINASNSMNNICALLLASSAAGRDGIDDALEAIRLTLESAVGPRPNVSLSFPFAYNAFLILADRQEQIASDILLGADKFRERLNSLLDLVFKVWDIAKNSPLIFAQFSLPPPTRPDPVIIHNWAFGSIALAKSLGQFERMQSALVLAAEVPLLKDPIAQARAVRLASGERGPLDPAVIRSESTGAFYAALGQRLIFLKDVSPDERESILEALLDQCLRFGPNGLDAAVFLAAGESRISGRRNSPACTDYLRRLDNNRYLRLSLMPFLADERLNS